MSKKYAVFITVLFCLFIFGFGAALLLSPSRDQAETWAQVFQDDPSALYLNIIKLLNQPKEDEHETE